MTKTNYTIVVDIRGQMIACTDGFLEGGTPEMRAQIRKASHLGERIQLIPPFGEEVEAALDETNALGALAAIASLRGSWDLKVAPEEVWDFLRNQPQETNLNY